MGPDQEECSTRTKAGGSKPASDIELPYPKRSTIMTPPRKLAKEAEDMRFGTVAYCQTRSVTDRSLLGHYASSPSGMPQNFRKNAGVQWVAAEHAVCIYGSFPSTRCRILCRSWSRSLRVSAEMNRSCPFSARLQSVVTNSDRIMPCNEWPDPNRAWPASCAKTCARTSQSGTV